MKKAEITGDDGSIFKTVNLTRFNTIVQKSFSPLWQIGLFTFGYLCATSNTALAQVAIDSTVNIDSKPFHSVPSRTKVSDNSLFERDDLEQTLLQACQANREIPIQNGLSIKGKGGILPAPGLPLDSHNIFIDGQTSSDFSAPVPLDTD